MVRYSRDGVFREIGGAEMKPSMIERVAQAIELNRGTAFLGIGAACSVALAKVAIEAMREPTDNIICAVLDAHDRATSTPRVIDDWRVAIDAALKDDH